MKGVYTINSAYSSVYVLKVLMKGAYSMNNAYSNACVLKVLIILQTMHT
jgi:hypothetical protein